MMLLVVGGNVMAVDGAAEKIKPQLEQMSLEGTIIQKITETKTGRKNTYYYLKTDETNMVKLANQAKGKKGYTDAAKVDLKNYVDKYVSITVKATMTKKGKPTVKVITEFTAI